ncbi:uncharacterized protein LOC142465152 isoform X2 [Ascaphus truei]|uniref:uncharacterized protein LOC142465152 isoform X2 n=1 Tax=Ascaphus truei TaxID=8439 RepID=UPI003F5A134B
MTSDLRPLLSNSGEVTRCCTDWDGRGDEEGSEDSFTSQRPLLEINSSPSSGSSLECAQILLPVDVLVSAQFGGSSPSLFSEEGDSDCDTPTPQGAREQSTTPSELQEFGGADDETVDGQRPETVRGYPSLPGPTDDGTEVTSASQRPLLDISSSLSSGEYCPPPCTMGAKCETEGSPLEHANNLLPAAEVPSERSPDRLVTAQSGGFPPALFSGGKESVCDTPTSEPDTGEREKRSPPPQLQTHADGSTFRYEYPRPNHVTCHAAQGFRCPDELTLWALEYLRRWQCHD